MDVKKVLRSLRTIERAAQRSSNAALDTRVLLDITQTAQLLQTSKRSIHNWGDVFGLPKPIFLPPDRTRYWRPDELRVWVQHRERLSREAIPIEAVCERTGLSMTRWRTLVKMGHAPACAGRELGTGKHLWWACDVTAWRANTTGGYRVPPRHHGTRAAPRLA
jgi:predicted DNA-binding transcriptional regulator AlpA